MASRLNMNARDASGKQVSLLNDDPTPISSSPRFRDPNYGPQHSDMIPSYSNPPRKSASATSSPRTPSLLRSDSYDSQTTNDPLSPITPTYLMEYGRQSSYTTAAVLKDSTPQYELQRMPAYHDYPLNSGQPYGMAMRPSYADRRSPSYAEPQTYDDDRYINQGTSDRGGKRYPCRFNESHGCEKTFTTSGHASRHSKIHTAEKAVHCSYQGCHKKFTRADNMKQHLETHFKDRSRSSASQKPAAPRSNLTSPAGIKKPVSVGRSSRPPSRNAKSPEYAPHAPAILAGDRYSSTIIPHAIHSAAASPVASYGSLDMGGFRSALISGPMAPRTERPSGGLDVLANIAACQAQN